MKVAVRSEEEPNFDDKLLHIFVLVHVEVFTVNITIFGNSKCNNTLNTSIHNSQDKEVSSFLKYVF